MGSRLNSFVHHRGSRACVSQKHSSPHGRLRPESAKICAKFQNIFTLMGHLCIRISKPRMSSVVLCCVILTLLRRPTRDLELPLNVFLPLSLSKLFLPPLFCFAVDSRRNRFCHWIRHRKARVGNPPSVLPPQQVPILGQTAKLLLLSVRYFASS